MPAVLSPASTKSARSGIRINAGFFVLKREIFSYIEPGEELVLEPFQRLIRERQLAAYEYDGFFAAMDTFKDKQLLRYPGREWRSSLGSLEKL